MAAFAGNSLLTRGALGHQLIDAPSFTLIRLITGAAMLALLVSIRRRESIRSGLGAGSWTSAVWLAGYAVAFTLAYTLIGAGVGALVLFGAVQATMILSGLTSGERPRMLDWIGFALAMTGLGLLTLHAGDRPNGGGALLMVIAGACWGAYSIAGRRSRDPMAATAGNFWRASVLGVLALGLLVSPSRITAGGALLATASGALTSGLGYTIWYSVLPDLGAFRAAIVQLTVPVLTALAATAFLGESITTRLLIAAALVGTGVGLSLRKT